MRATRECLTVRNSVLLSRARVGRNVHIIYTVYMHTSNRLKELAACSYHLDETKCSSYFTGLKCLFHPRTQ